MCEKRTKTSNPELARRKSNRRANDFVGNIRQSISAQFGAALRERRRELGLTQMELARKSGLSRSYISEVECGKESISLERAERLAQALECHLADLLSARRKS